VAINPFSISPGIKGISPINIDLAKENAALIVFGHTHKPEIVEKDNKLCINPGETGGWLSGKSTVVIVDLKDLSHKSFTL